MIVSKLNRIENLPVTIVLSAFYKRFTELII